MTKKRSPLRQHARTIRKHLKLATKSIEAAREYLTPAEMRLARALVDVAKMRGRLTVRVKHPEIAKRVDVSSDWLYAARQTLAKRKLIRVGECDDTRCWTAELLDGRGQSFPGETGSTAPITIKDGGIEWTLP